MLLGRNTLERIPWVQLVVEATLVVFSVLLALGIKSCREANTHKQLADKALRNFKYEILANKTEIKRVLKSHRIYLDTLRSKNPPKGINIQTPDVQNSAWQVAQSTGGISYIDFSITKIASKIHEKQRQYQNYVEEVRNLVFEGTINADKIKNKERVTTLFIMVNGLYALELDLLKSYKTALKRIGNAGISIKDDSIRKNKQ